MTAASVLDDQTTAAIRDAISAARSGRIPDALSIGERALAKGGDPAALNAMLGSLQCQVGNLDAGIRHLRSAREARPSDPVIAANLATALAQQGDPSAAIEILTEEVTKADPSMRLQRIRAFLAQELRDFAVAIPAYEKVVAASPDDWESWNNLGNARRLAGDAEGSLAALQRAIDLNPKSPPVRLNYGMSLAGVGRVDEAEQQLRMLASDNPLQAEPLRELHLIQKELGREEDALESIEEAARRDPKNLELLMALASQCLSLLRTEAAEETYRKVLEVQPDHELANLGLAVVFELTNRTGDLARFADDVQKRGVSENVVNFVRAMDHRRAKRFSDGLTALALVPEDLESTRRYHLLGQLHEGAGNYAEAFAAFSRMNELQAADLSRPTERATAYRNSIRKQIEIVTPEWSESWRMEGRMDERPAPAFLVGFPRSGTTLLDTMLMGHSDVEVLEEEPTLLKAARLLQPFEQIPVAPEEQIRAAREEYFRVAALQTPLKPGKLLIDKNPLSMNYLPIIHRLFPNARIILALRHPCDVVLSCFATNFKINDGMSNFHRLDTTAEMYGLSFTYFEQAREVFGLPVHTIYYEKVVEDRERELRSLMNFLGLEWRDALLDHETTAQKRGRIKTASYAQVGQPIYSQAAGRWTNFRKHLEPILPVLEPWAAKFGYTL